MGHLFIDWLVNQPIGTILGVNLHLSYNSDENEKKTSFPRLFIGISMEFDCMKNKRDHLEDNTTNPYKMPIVSFLFSKHCLSE